MITILLAVITILVITSSIYKDIMYQRERKDLLNRIMARDLAEYKDVNNNQLPKGKNNLKPKEVEFSGLYE